MNKKTTSMEYSIVIEILAWGNMLDQIHDELEEEYRKTYKQNIHITWSSYVGGSDFVSVLKGREGKGSIPDIVVADREILQSFAIDGRLYPISTISDPSKNCLREYPECLKSWAINIEHSLYAVPLRWGIASFLIKKSLLNKKNQLSLKTILMSSKDTLLWTPKKYFFPSMGLISSAISPVNPFVLNNGSFNELSSLLDEIGSNNKTVNFSDYPQNLANDINSIRPDVMVCGGDWVLRSLEYTNPDIYQYIKKEYQYRHYNKPQVFFEMAAIMSTTKYRQEAINVINLMSSHTFRAKIEDIKLNQMGYVSNPTTHGSCVMGPDFSQVPIYKVLNNAMPRNLPKDILFQPMAGKWKELWSSWRESMRQGNV